MHFRDNIDYPPLLTRPSVFVPLLGAIFAGMWWFNGADSAIGRIVAGIFPSMADSSGLNLLTAAIATAFVGFNIFVVMRLPLRQQVWLVWGELALLILLFFYSFNLSFAFIQRKIGFLITQGLVTTLYISAISIAIATVLALLGAVAKLSSNGIAQGIAHFYTSLFRGPPLLMQADRASRVISSGAVSVRRMGFPFCCDDEKWLPEKPWQMTRVFLSTRTAILE